MSDTKPSYVIAQRPNAPLAVALVSVVVGWVTHGLLQDITHVLFLIAIAIWCTLEITSGVNAFRRALGAGVAISVLIGLLRPLFS